MAGLFARSISEPVKMLADEMIISNLDENGQMSTREDEVGILINSFNVMKTNTRKLIADNKLKEEKKRQAEIESLQAQISPHFLFNTLNSIRWIAISDGSDKAAEMVFSLGQLLRMTIAKEDSLITLQEELDILDNYIRIVQMRHGFNVEITFDVRNSLETMKLPKLLLQPLVENSVIHGFEDMDKKGIIKVCARLLGKHVIITIEDNGKGFQPKDYSNNQSYKNVKFSGIGLDNVRERIKLHYGEQYGLHIGNKNDKGTIVSIEIPLKVDEVTK
jgi:two-component system sensor histidine kinase YesM